ncbi:MAG: Co2+/Mg2+ efflux protein ApaG [Geminicoccaceae bacterium]
MYEQITDGIRVAVEPFYLEEQSEPSEDRFVFGYRVMIENVGNGTVRLIGRHWQIIDAVGRQMEVHGDGVVGEQPILAPGESFEYTSGAPLAAPSGIMHGTYHMRREDSAVLFDVAIPAFSLDAPGAVHTPH